LYPIDFKFDEKGRLSYRNNEKKSGLLQFPEPRSLDIALLAQSINVSYL